MRATIVLLQSEAKSILSSFGTIQGWRCLGRDPSNEGHWDSSGNNKESTGEESIGDVRILSSPGDTCSR